MALLPNYKNIVELLKKGSTIEAQEKIIELREGALSLQEENIKLREKIRKLESELNKKKEVVWEPPYYWLVDDQSKDGPFCQNCYDKNGNLIRLQGDGAGWWECKSCKNQFTDDSYSHEDSVFVVPE